MNQTEQNFLDQAESAFLLFCERYPDYPQTEANARQMATELRAANLFRPTLTILRLCGTASVRQSPYFHRPRQPNLRTRLRPKRFA
jgi:hypothetical protein